MDPTCLWCIMTRSEKDAFVEAPQLLGQSKHIIPPLADALRKPLSLSYATKR